MIAIAHGVEVRQELLTGHSKVVTQETVDIARRLQMPEEEIEGWVATRKMLESQINAVIKSLQRN